MAFEKLPLSAVPAFAVEHLLDLAFGADRKLRTAYLLRSRGKIVPALSWAVMDGSDIIGSIQCWSVRIGRSPLVLVGPVAVRPDHQGTGIGHQLMQLMLEQSEKLGNPAMVMIGDPEYYSRFGFSADETAGWSLPGPWEPHRLLARNTAQAGLPTEGMIEEDCDAL
jgi:predicted N-acetyltransferase YhbS